MQRNYGANGPMHYSISALAPSPHSLSFSLFTFTYCSVLVPKGEKSFLISSALFFTHLGPGCFFFFFFAEAGSHFISLIISLSTTSHKGISNKYFLPLLLVYFSDLLHIHRSSTFLQLLSLARYNNGSTINFCGTQ